MAIDRALSTSSRKRVGKMAPKACEYCCTMKHKCDNTNDMYTFEMQYGEGSWHGCSQCVRKGRQCTLQREVLVRHMISRRSISVVTCRGSSRSRAVPSTPPLSHSVSSFPPAPSGGRINPRRIARRIGSYTEIFAPEDDVTSVSGSASGNRFSPSPSIASSSSSGSSSTTGSLSSWSSIDKSSSSSSPFPPDVGSLRSLSHTPPVSLPDLDGFATNGDDAPYGDDEGPVIAKAVRCPPKMSVLALKSYRHPWDEPCAFPEILAAAMALDSQSYYEY